MTTAITKNEKASEQEVRAQSRTRNAEATHQKNRPHRWAVPAVDVLESDDELVVHPPTVVQRLFRATHDDAIRHSYTVANGFVEYLAARAAGSPVRTQMQRSADGNTLEFRCHKQL